MAGEKGKRKQKGEQLPAGGVSLEHLEHHQSTRINTIPNPSESPCQINNYSAHSVSVWRIIYAFGAARIYYIKI